MPLEPLYVTNRVVVTILPKAPFVEWINAADPTPANATVTFEDAREERACSPQTAPRGQRHQNARF
ncbi:hypothetical protein GJQ57_16195 [Ralstonia pickettii]|uniref:Uncharacterized protein n=1 Tax=Ralstonia pickettii TaxID=329 RepID=A0A7X2HP91_RALPI|nr:hypothetical protein [Ralstonia pickettii]MRT00183.1 hypothetical protein [Ralstonia pickettii]